MVIVILCAIGAIGVILALGIRPGEKTEPAIEDESRLGDRLAKLRALPYTSVTKEKVDPSVAGVVTMNPGLTWDGYNFYAAGIAGKVVLMDMSGQVTHLWTDPRRHKGSFGFPLLLPQGDIIVLQKYRGLIRLDWNSNIVWTTDSRAHHELMPLGDSTFYLFEIDMRQYRGLIVRFDIIVRRNLRGEIVETWSTYEHLEEIRQALDRRSFLDTILDSLEATGRYPVNLEDLPGEIHSGIANEGCGVFDYFHANRICPLPQTHLAAVDSRFRAGNLLICLRNVNQIAILDKDTMEILWVWGEGDLEWPHHPTMLETGNILIYDNGIERKYTRVIELNPITLEIEWQYGEDPGQRFFSRTRGSCQRLPNGNTLICDSNNGRAFEVTESGEVVWEWLNPDMKNERRMKIYRMMRLDPSVVDPLLVSRLKEGTHRDAGSIPGTDTR